LFTGIIEEVGEIFERRKYGEGEILGITCENILEELKPGDSVAVNGTCLTARKITTRGFCADVMPLTLVSTNLYQLSPGSKVNLERALKLGDRLGGHMVQGHVDGTGTIRDVCKSSGFSTYFITTDSKLLRYIVLKGSISIDGISLTIQGVEDSGFCVGIIPTTLMTTTLKDKKQGDIVNIETDILGKYVDRLMQKTNDGFTVGDLRSMGY